VKIPRKLLLPADFPTGLRPPAPIPLHMPVNSMHTIEKQADKGALFPLTKKIEGVKRQSFFDIF
jgi:hypothetical protein